VLGQGSRIAAELLCRESAALEVELSMAVKPVGTMKGIRMVMVTDVSLRNQASREAAEKNIRLADANEKLNQFAFIASHDLQEPLRKIQQFSSFLEEDLGDALDKDIDYYLRVIVDSSNRMSDLINDLLCYSRTSKLEPEMESVQLEEVVEDVINELEISIKECEGQVELGNLPSVSGNLPLLRQLFTNLIGNGLKYRVVDRTPVIKVYATNTQGKEQIVIADNGIGLDMRYARKIFEPFNRLHTNQEYKGNGIGLAICQTVCEKHGWSIAADGIPNEGTKFIVTLDSD
jgi:light-regulated signal transduction histidine kinase (bacteriophytochrome)